MNTFQTTPALSRHWPLAEVLDRLRQQPAVDGLLLVGSAAHGQLTANSDYDLLIVLAEAALEVRVGLTVIDERLADLLFASVAELDELLASATVSAESWLGRIALWCESGTVLFDRGGRLTAVQHKVAQPGWISAPEPHSSYAMWFSINYNLLQTERLHRSTDPVYQQAVEMRLLYSVSDLLTGYFGLRGLVWPGEKAAVRYWQAHDPAYLALCTAYHAAEQAMRLACYARLAAYTVAPAGGLWPEAATAFRLAQNENHRTLAQMQDFWAALLGTKDPPSSDPPQAEAAR